MIDKTMFSQDDPTDAGFCGKANFEGKLTTVVVHSYGEMRIYLKTNYLIANNGEAKKGYPPQLYMRLSTFLTDSLSRTLSEVTGQIPPLARVAAITDLKHCN